MNINGYKPGKTMTFTAPGGGVTTGVPVLIGALLVIPTATVAAGSSFEGMTEGVFPGLAKTAGVAWTEGMLLYWDSATSSFSTVVGATTRRVGCAVSAALLAATTGDVRLTGAPAPANVA